LRFAWGLTMAALSEDEVKAKLSGLDGWELKGGAIEK
jgi:hypothetical protein